MAKAVKETPLMQQYNAIKAKYPGALLLFRVGDFYETFAEDAVTTSRILGIVLTKRANGSASHIELAGFPHHSLDNYLSKLVRAGQRVAICDQLEDPKATKTIVKRGVTELVTPGVAYSDNIVKLKSNNFLAAIHISGNSFGIAFLDISTGEFLVSEGDKEYIDKLLQSFSPSEVLYSRQAKSQFQQLFGSRYYTHVLDDWVFTIDYGQETLTKHFAVATLKGYGIHKLDKAVIAAGAALHYVKETEHRNLQHISSLSRIYANRHVWLDRFTIRNLELVAPSGDEGSSLFSVLDNCVTPMGSRLLHKWILMPLIDARAIEQRLNSVESFINTPLLLQQITALIKPVGDLERLISKVGLFKVGPREVLQIQKALDAVAEIKITIAQTSNAEHLLAMGEKLNPLTALSAKIAAYINAEAPAVVLKGGVIAAGVSAELDKLRDIAGSGKNYLLLLQQREAEATGIPSLKVAYNNVFGYYLEVTNTHKDKVPDTWLRKQTLVNAERYITPELKEYEETILTAEEKISALEIELYNQLVFEIAGYISHIQLNAQVLAQLDCLTCFAGLAIKQNYHKPLFNSENIIDIKGGRHPVIELMLPPGQEYICNDVLLDPAKQQIIVITGPNMAGKSAILRQTGLIVLMAQMGCYVPAKSATLGITDKIFTRVGATDNISSGESTFMVEMNETASILNNLSGQSLILLDEIGRGTSTFDGISIAWAIAEYIHQHPHHKAKTLFATHYHELNDLSNSFERIKNYNVQVKELDDKIIFLRKLIPGGSQHSFGIHVARLAGMPHKVITRANEILKRLEINRTDGKSVKDNIKSIHAHAYQLQMFAVDDPVLLKIRDALNTLDVNALTPVEALLKLDEIQRLIKT